MGTDGSLRCVTRRKVLWLSPDGLLSTAAIAHEDFLGWYINERRASNQSLALNPRVTTEYVLEFCRFVHTEFKPSSPGTTWDLWLSIVGFNRRGGVVLPAGQSASPFRRDEYDERRPIESNAHKSVASRASSGEDAYRLLVELYALFAKAPDSIPYVVQGETSAESILESSRKHV